MGRDSSWYNHNVIAYMDKLLAFDKIPLANFKTFAQDISSLLTSVDSVGGYSPFSHLAEVSTKQVSHSTLRLSLCNLNKTPAFVEQDLDEFASVYAGQLMRCHAVSLTRLEVMKRASCLQVSDIFSMLAEIARGTPVAFKSAPPLVKALLSDETTLPYDELVLSRTTIMGKNDFDIHTWLNKVITGYSRLEEQLEGTELAEVTMLIAYVLAMLGFPSDLYTTLNGTICVTSEAFALMGLQPIDSLFSTRVQNLVLTYLNGVLSSLSLWVSPDFGLWFYPSGVVTPLNENAFTSLDKPYYPESYTQKSADVSEGVGDTFKFLQSELCSGEGSSYFLRGTSALQDNDFFFEHSDSKIVPVAPSKRVLDVLHSNSKTASRSKTRPASTVITKSKKEACAEEALGLVKHVTFSELSEIVGNKAKMSVHKLESKSKTESVTVEPAPVVVQDSKSAIKFAVTEVVDETGVTSVSSAVSDVPDCPFDLAENENKAIVGTPPTESAEVISMSETATEMEHSLQLLEEEVERLTKERDSIALKLKLLELDANCLKGKIALLSDNA